MTAELLTLLLATAGAGAGLAVVALVRWLLARRRTAGVTWTLRCLDCERAGIPWGGTINVSNQMHAVGFVRAYLRNHWDATAHLPEARSEWR